MTNQEMKDLNPDLIEMKWNDDHGNIVVYRSGLGYNVAFEIQDHCGSWYDVREFDSLPDAVRHVGKILIANVENDFYE